MENVNCLSCRFRHKDNGNCTAVGGFCTAVSAAHCPLLREYLDTGLKPQDVSKLIKDRSDFSTADVAPVVHARWITRNDKGIISMTHPYMCSRCWRVEMNKEPYCNCGAKMDGGDNDADD